MKFKDLLKFLQYVKAAVELMKFTKKVPELLDEATSKYNAQPTPGSQPPSDQE